MAPADEHERRWMSAAHLSAIPGMLIGLGFLGPMLVLWRQGRSSVRVRRHALAALNFNLTVGVVGVAAIVVGSTMSTDPGPGEPDYVTAAAFVTLLLLSIGWFLATVRATLQARYGVTARYPFSFPFVRDR